MTVDQVTAEGHAPSEVLVVIVTYNSEAVIGSCLSALPASAGAGSLDVVVVDNASTDDTLAVVQACRPGTAVVRLPCNAGYAAAINAGAARAGRETAVLVLNPDVRLAPGSVARLQERLAQPGTGIAVPRLEDASGRLALSLRREPTISRVFGEALLGVPRAGRVVLLGETVSDPAAYVVATAADWATGCAMLISAACRWAVGGWDESFFLYSEETDFALRARAQGFALRLEPEARAVHLGGESTSSALLWTLLILNKIECYGRHHGRVRTAAFRAGLILNELLRTGRGRPIHRAGLRAVLRPGGRDAALHAIGAGAAVRRDEALSSQTVIRPATGVATMGEGQR